MNFVWSRKYMYFVRGVFFLCVKRFLDGNVFFGKVVI